MFWLSMDKSINNMIKKISIIIDDVRYDRVKAKTCLSCDECDLEHLCENVASKFPMLCHALTDMDGVDYIFKKAEK